MVHGAADTEGAGTASFLVQLLLPLRDNDRIPFPSEHYRTVISTLTQRFGGVTAYTRAPAEGRWRDGPAEVADDVVIIEVMAPDLDGRWWRSFRDSLERLFRQDQIVLRAMTIRLL